MNSMQVVSRKIDDLIPYARNARTHPPDQIKKLEASLVEFGWANPILTDGRNGIIAGHGRVQAATALRDNPKAVIPNWPDKTTAPTIDLSHLTDAQKRAYILIDNRSALDSGWDNDLLSLELKDLSDLGFDLSLTGFDDNELEAFLAEPVAPGLTDPDDAPELPVNPVSRLGDVWLMGKHRLVCGDCTDADTVAKVLKGVEPHLMVTDPPYGVQYDPSWRNETDRKNGKSYGAQAIGKVMNDDNADWSEAWSLFSGDVAYVWHGERQLVDMAIQLRDSGFETRNLIVWGKSRLVIGRGHYHSQHETCWYAVRKGGTGHWSGDRKQTTFWQIDHRNSETGHSTQKPVECMKRPIENNSSPGQAVYEPFSGSGTTIIACELTGRACHAIELNPVYVDVAVNRWQQHTGKQVVLEGDGRTFEEIDTDRYGDGTQNSLGCYDEAIGALRERKVVLTGNEDDL